MNEQPIVIFVDMHNKPNTEALSSDTKTGKVIDQIIKKIPYTCLKTNLCDIDYFPEDKEVIKKCVKEWFGKYNNTPQIVVTLGQWTYDNFTNYTRFNSVCKFTLIKAKHPAGVFGPNNKNKYIDEVVSNILNISF